MKEKFVTVFIWLCRLGTFMGLFLLCINITGCLMGRNVFYQPERHALYAPLQDYRLLQMKPDESTYEYASRMNSLVYTSTVHYFANEMAFGDIHKKAVPFLYNWALWAEAFRAHIKGRYYTFEFASAESGLARGYGLCSQRALILEDLLTRNGIHAKTTGLYGHVILKATIDDKEMIFDPDYNVIMPFSLSYLATTTSLVAHYYKNSPSLITPEPYLVAHYNNSPPAVIATQHSNYIAGIYSQNLQDDYYANIFPHAERKYQRIKWVFPCILLLPGIIIEGWIYKHRRF